VKPNVKVKPVIAQPKDETEDPAQSGWWPPFEGEGFPAISTDGKKVAVIEHADYFGHTQTPGVRLVDVASGRSDFLSLVPPGKHARDMPALLKAVPACEAKAAAANNALAKLAWESLAEPADDDYATAEWTVDGLKITNERDDATGWPKKLTLLDAASSKVLVTKDVTGWTRSRIRCATPSLRLVGVSRARGVVVFSQQLGGTLHDCDSVVVPTDYRVVALPP
jgi:hypothetical protein